MCTVSLLTLCFMSYLAGTLAVLKAMGNSFLLVLTALSDRTEDDDQIRTKKEKLHKASHWLIHILIILIFGNTQETFISFRLKKTSSVCIRNNLLRKWEKKWLRVFCETSRNHWGQTAWNYEFNEVNFPSQSLPWLQRWNKSAN